MTTPPSISLDDPAFPLGYTSGGGHNGMSIRVWLTGQALAGMASLNHLTDDEIATKAVARADAAIAALNRGNVS